MPKEITNQKINKWTEEVKCLPYIWLAMVKSSLVKSLAPHKVFQTLLGMILKSEPVVNP